MIPMSFSKLSLATLGEAALIAAGGGLAAYYSPQLDLVAIVGVVLLARFRGRVQSLIGVFSFSLMALVSAIASPRFAHSHTDLVQLVAAICAMCVCTIFVSRAKLERWVTINWDIDERKRAEQQIRDQLTQLNLLGERFPGFLWKALPDGRVTYINRYCEDYLGMTAQEAAADWGRLIHPDDRDEVARRWAIVASGGQWHDHVHRLIGRDGQYRWFQSRITAIRDESGSVVALHGLMMDADDVVSAERSVRQEEKQLRRLVDSMLLEQLQTAGLLRSTDITPLPRYYKPLRDPLAIHRFPGCTSYTASCSANFSSGRGGFLQLLSAS